MTIGITTILVLFGTSCFLNATPSWLILHFGDFRSGRHWSHNARPLAVMRALNLIHFYCFPIVILGPLVVFVHDFPSRIVGLMAVMAGVTIAARLQSPIVARAHEFPKRVVSLENERGMLHHNGVWLVTLVLILTYGLDVKLRLAAVALTLGVSSISYISPMALPTLLGLVEPLPPYLKEFIAQRAPHVRTLALRTIQANALAFPHRQMVVFTTGAVQRVTPEGLKAIAVHESNI